MLPSESGGDYWWRPTIVPRRCLSPVHDRFGSVASALCDALLRIDWPMFNCCSHSQHGTLLHFSLQSSRLNICYRTTTKICTRDGSIRPHAHGFDADRGDLPILVDAQRPRIAVRILHRRSGIGRYWDRSVVGQVGQVRTVLLWPFIVWVSVSSFIARLTPYTGNIHCFASHSVILTAVVTQEQTRSIAACKKADRTVYNGPKVHI